MDRTSALVAQSLEGTPDLEVDVPRVAADIGDRYTQRKLIVAPDALDATGAYCCLAAQIHKVRQSRPLSTVLIASAAPGEGKSLTAANLGLALSGSYQDRVMLVDADLRRPSLHKLFDTDNVVGLNEYLTGTSASIQPVPLSPRLSLLPGGNPAGDPLAALTSDRMKDLLSTHARQHDWVIVDAPPLAALPDGHLLAALVQSVVLVVRAGCTPLAAVESAIKIVGRQAILGVVLNRSSAPTGEYYYRYARRSYRG